MLAEHIRRSNESKEKEWSYRKKQQCAWMKAFLRHFSQSLERKHSVMLLCLWCHFLEPGLPILPFKLHQPGNRFLLHARSYMAFGFLLCFSPCITLPVTVVMRQKILKLRKSRELKGWCISPMKKSWGNWAYLAWRGEGSAETSLQLPVLEWNL